MRAGHANVHEMGGWVGAGMRWVQDSEKYGRLITAHESITTDPKYTYILCIYGL